MIRFLYSDHNSVCWLQGRLNSRVDTLETAVKSGWVNNRFEVDMISTLTHWGDLKPLPTIITVNLNNKTRWALGIQSGLSSKTGDDRNMKIRLGYTAATSMNLINDEYVAEDPNVNSSFVMRRMKYTYFPQEKD